MHHISEEEFRLINWLPTSKRIDQCINTITYNLVYKTSPYYLHYYLHEILNLPPHYRIGTRITFLNLKILFAKQTWVKKQFLILVFLFGTACLTQLKEQIV